MGLRKCTKEEAQLAAEIYGVNNEHELKSHVLGNYNSISNSDIFIDTRNGNIYVCNKDGTNPQFTEISLV
jgi:hypothetical protein